MIVISMSACTLAQTPEHTIKYATIMFPGPPYARALPVPMNNPLPMLEPRAMIFSCWSAVTNGYDAEVGLPKGISTDLELPRAETCVEHTAVTYDRGFSNLNICNLGIMILFFGAFV